MKTSRIAYFKASSAPVVLGLALLATPAFAQAAADEATNEDIVVTGSLISNPNLEQSTPVNVTTADQIELKQSNVAEEILRELPGVVPSIGSAVNNGNGGASYADLRGLGSVRNVVLVDGQRIAPSGLAGRVDLNNIPLALVERVDSLTGAAVTTYGADAITGVINFITRRDFTGLELTASEQITEQGDGNVFRVDATVGADFGDGRGNAVMSIGYQESDAVYQGGRDFSVDNIDSYSGAAGGSGTAVPSRFSLGAATRVIDPATGTLVPGFTPFNFNPYNIFQTPFSRYNMFAAAHYEISDAVEVYTRAMFSKNSVRTIIAPSGVFASSVAIPISNPYLPLAAAQQFCAANGISVAECTAARTALSPTDAAYRQVNTVLRRRTTETGTRDSDFTTTIFDYSIGLRGGLTESLDWDLRGSYGESENVQTQTGYVLTSRVRDALLATNVNTCLSGAAGCVPLNVFGAEGTITPAMVGYLLAPATVTIKTSLAQVHGTISGDLGFTLPTAATPIGIAIGGEYRRYAASQVSDSLSKQAGELGGAGGAAPDIDGGYDVYEAFAEVIAPLVEDAPFIRSLTLEAGIRYSAYSVEAPTNPTSNTTTWKVGGSWEPIEDLKFRGSYSRAVRAPNIGELFSPQSVGLTNLGTDPCAGAAPTTNANLRAICLAQGAPVGSIGIIANPTAAQANITTGGNVNLQPETANTWTIGAVFQPSALPGFSISVDYYDIKVKDVIGTPLPGDIIGACFGTVTAASAADAACTSIRRNPTTGGLDGDSSTTFGLFGATNNLGALATSGIDLIANYRTDLGFADLALAFTGNWTNSSTYNANAAAAGSLNRECVGFYSVNCSFTGSIQPEFQFSQRTTLSFENIDVSLLWRWVDSVSYEPAQLATELQGAIDAGTNPITGCPDPTGVDPNGCMIDPAYRSIPAEHYFDLTTRFNVSDNLTFTLTVQNMFNNLPKGVGSTIGSTSFNSGNVYPSTYDALGRRFAASVKLRF